MTILLLTSMITIVGAGLIFGPIIASMLFSKRKIKAVVTKDGKIRVPIDGDSHQRREDINAVTRVVKEVNEKYGQNITFDDAKKSPHLNKAEKKRRAANRRNNGKK